MTEMLFVPNRDALRQAMFVTAFPAAGYRDQLALAEHVDPCADVAECLPPTLGARGASQSRHVPKYRGVTVWRQHRA